MAEDSKEIKAIKEVRKKELEMWEKAIWCKEHNFPLEELKFRHAENICRRLASELEDIFDTGYAKVGEG